MANRFARRLSREKEGVCSPVPEEELLSREYRHHMVLAPDLAVLAVDCICVIVNNDRHQQCVCVSDMI